ncbi:MAG TPA: hypothetical protein DEQ02_09035 [Ruminococcaceae bacterium]|nr:hypothetical protein [Oscillospiraceae bacterium]
MLNSKLLKVLAALVLILTLVWAGSVSAAACTSLYLGKETTENGTYIWGRSEDISSRFSKLFTVHPAETHEPGERYQSSTGFSWPYPAKTLRYTMAKDSFHNEGTTPEPYAEVGVNEKNVAMSATTTISRASSAISAIDPQISTSRGGLAETDLTTVVLMQAETARGAMELVAEIIDTVGAAGRESFTVSDPNEVWMMEILSGHQYVAVKAPADKIAFSPNITMHGAVDPTDTENVIVSPDFVKTAEDAGTIVRDENGNIIVSRSYTNAGTSVPGRMYLGYYYLQGVEAAKALTPGYFNYYMDPREGSKYTLYEAMRFLAYHGNPDDPADGKYVANPSSNGSAIGNANTVESHLFETRDDMPADLATVEWIAMGPAEFSIYLPYYGSQITETFENYTAYDSPSSAPDYRSMYWLFRSIYALCNADRTNVAPKVSEFLEAYQKELIRQHKEIDEIMAEVYAYEPLMAQKKATDISKAAAQQAYTVMTSIREEILAYNQNTDPDKGVFVPSVLNAPIDTKYTFNSVGGTGLPAYDIIKIQENDSHLIYNGNWGLRAQIGRFDEHVAKSSSQTNASVSFTFKGTGFSLISYKSYSQGTFDVYIDGVKDKSVNNYQPGTDSAFQQVVYRNRMLEDAVHTVTIVLTGRQDPSIGSNVYVDAFEIIGVLDGFTQGGTLVDDDVMIVDASPIIIDVLANDNVDDSAVIELISFNTATLRSGMVAIVDDGKKIKYTPDRLVACDDDEFTYTVDGETATVTLIFAEKMTYQENFISEDLKFGNNDHPQKTPGWGDYNLAAYWNSSAKRSNQAGDMVEITFYGTGIEIIGYKSWSRGQFEATIWNGGVPFTKTVSCFDPSYDTHYRASVYNSKDEGLALTEGWHTLIIKVRGDKETDALGTAIDIDAINIYR